MTKPVPAIRHLSPSARALYAEIVRGYELEGHHKSILIKSLEAFDRAETARAIIEVEGVLTTSRLGESKANPAVGIERDARSAFFAGIRQLGLDLEVGPPPPSARRPR